MTPAELAELLALRDTLRAAAERIDELTKAAAVQTERRRIANTGGHLQLSFTHELHEIECSGEGGKEHAVQCLPELTGRMRVQVLPERAAFPAEEWLSVRKDQAVTVWLRERGAYTGTALVFLLTQYGSRNGE